MPLVVHNSADLQSVHGLRCQLCVLFVAFKTFLLIVSSYSAFKPQEFQQILECGPMPNLMVALPNIGGAFCSTPQSLSDAHY